MAAARAMNMAASSQKTATSQVKQRLKSHPALT
jgi:hypothetical protein